MVNARGPSQGRPVRTHNAGPPLDRFGSTLYGTLLGDEDDMTSRDTGTRRPYVPTLRATRHDGTRLIPPLTFQRNTELGRARSSLWPEFPVPVAQMLNNESRTRLMVNRLNDLISQLCALRVRAVSLSESSAQISTSALQINLGGLDNSLLLLDTAIKDLEDRVSSATRRLDRASGRSISDWVTLGREPVQQTSGFTSSPSRSLISLARSDHVDQNPSVQSRSTTIGSTSDLPDRLGHFSESLANLNSRLDRVASNFRNMQEQEAPESDTVSSWLTNGYSATAASGNYSQGNSLAPPTTLPPVSTGGMPGLGVHGTNTNSNTSTLTGSFLSGPHEIPAWSDRSFLDMLQSDGQDVDGQVQETDASQRTSQPGSTASPRMRELNDETYTARSQHRHEQEELLKQEEAPLRRQPATPNIAAQSLHKRDEYEFPEPKLSSHVPLFRDQERIFVDGVEYRNCLGLWLSYTGEHAPAHALPNCYRDDSNSMQESRR